ncbi:MAG: phosphatase PAP2 family protein [Actinomycetota bacterium]|nr:phosphatase PAP2 family protein [Actinomycetota bacterium]
MASRALSRYAHLLTVELIAGLVVLTASAWVFGWMAEELVEGDTHLDTRLATWLHERATPGWTEFFETVTTLGNVPVLINVALVAALVLAWRRELDELRLLLLAVIGAEVLTVGLKLGFQRERPFFADPLATESSYSFPSGHASVSLALYGTLALILVRHARALAVRISILAAAAILTGLIGFSRLYLGVHFLSDVIAGFSLAIAWITLCMLLLHLRVRLKQGPQQAVQTSRYRASTKQYSP